MKSTVICCTAVFGHFSIFKHIQRVKFTNLCELSLRRNLHPPLVLGTFHNETFLVAYKRRSWQKKMVLINSWIFMGLLQFAFACSDGATSIKHSQALHRWMRKCAVDFTTEFMKEQRWKRVLPWVVRLCLCVCVSNCNHLTFLPAPCALLWSADISGPHVHLDACLK